MQERISRLIRPVRVASLFCAASVLAMLASHHAQRAQEAGAAVADEVADAADLVAGDDLLGEDELDLIVAPVALYPDSLLTQIFVASTYPLDVVKAARFVEDSVELSGSARTDATEAEDWDPSIQVLAAGFPDTVTRMAEDLDWTEDLGNAVLAQTDDVLDAVQRQRARALAVGNLESNAAQEIEVSEETISVRPADPEVVYVPTYDPATTYSTRSAAPAVIDPGGSYSTGDMVATGAIAFGSALLINEIFDDDDDWDDYWRGPPSIDWDDNAFYPRRGVNVDGDVNIDVDRNRVNLDRDRNDRLNIDRDGNDRIGALDRIDRDRGDGKWSPPADRRDEARRKLENRDKGEGRGAAARDKVAARSGGSAADAGDARQKREAAKAKRPAAKTDTPRQTALKKPDRGGKKPTAARERGEKSVAKVSKPKAAVSRPAPKAKPKQVSRPKVKAAPKRASPPKASAFKKSHSGHKAKAASSRGGKSHGRKVKRR